MSEIDANNSEGRTLEETAALFDGEALPQEIEASGGAAATMSMSRAPGFHQATEVRYEKAPGTDFLELQGTTTIPGSIDSRTMDSDSV